MQMSLVIGLLCFAVWRFFPGDGHKRKNESKMDQDLRFFFQSLNLLSFNCVALFVFTRRLLPFCFSIICAAFLKISSLKGFQIHKPLYYELGLL
jgi:hypothetical protein